TFVLPQVPVQVQQDAGNSTASAATAPVQRITIQMGDNEFTFDPMSVPDVPNVNYSQKIDELFVDWDSELRASLVVEKQKIPIKYWPEFYKKRKGVTKASSWGSRKGQWGKWRDIVEERQRFSSNADFWTKWSNANGQRMNYNTITKCLKESRAIDDKREADEARAFYENRPEDGREFFGYTKSGAQCAMTTDEAIARKWRKVKEENIIFASGANSQQNGMGR
ncbi:hypothetical protein SCHPADRAFT_990199, partial [Schizopora paradoxa]